MKTKKVSLRRGLKSFVLYLPLAAALGAGFLPLRPVAQQALIGVVLFWVTFTFMIGLHN